MNDLSTLSFDEVVAAIRAYQENSLTDSDRVEFWSQIQEGYCTGCGDDNPRCQCQNDE